MTSDKPFPIAKITPPTIPGVIPRDGIFRLLKTDSGPAVTWISTPAGFGKTALASGYLADRKIPHIWYRLDERDSEISTFFHYLGIAAGALLRSSREPHRIPGREPGLGVSGLALDFFEPLFSRLPTPFLMVFDDYHHIPADSPLHTALAATMEILPAGFHALFLSRGHPPSRFARLRAGGLMGILGPEELRLSQDEAGRIVRTRGLGRLSPGNVQRLHERSRGWAAGLTLMLESIERRKTENLPASDLDDREIFDYFETEIFATIDPRTRSFLLRSAFLSVATVKGARRLTREKRAGELLSRLHLTGLFTDSSGGPNPAYRYHPLFREFLLSRAVDTLSPNEVARLKRNTARILFDEDLLEDAAEALIDARDWYALIQLILKNSRHFFPQGRIETINRCLSAIHLEIVRNTPWPVMIYTLGKFELLLDGKPAGCSGKAQRKPLQLLKMLIALGCSGVKEEDLTDTLWPEADGDRGHSAFTTTLSRLRRLLGCHAAIEINEGKASLNPRYCWVDVRAFEQLAGRVESTSAGVCEAGGNGDNGIKAVVRLAEQALEIYKGPFLRGEGNHLWLLQPRERLHNRFLRVVATFGRHLETLEQWEKAAECYRTALESDEGADEEVYQRLMICHHRLDQPTKAIEAYRRCSATLAETFGRKPSPRTEEIYRKLVI